MSKSNLETILEIQSVNIIVDSEHEIDDLNQKMDYICNKTAEEFYKIKIRLEYIGAIFENNFNEKLVNKNFDDHELFEEQMDELFHEYIKIKELIKHGRNIRFYKEKKESEKKKELRCARNELAQHGIESIYY